MIRMGTEMQSKVKFAAAALTCCVAFGMSVSRLVAQNRQKITINESWRYVEGDIPGASVADFEDSSWTVLDLPHTWNALDAYDKVPGYRRGVGWYRKRLDDVLIRPGRRYYVYFEGANQITDVYLNSDHLGRHVGGYTAFVFEVTDQLVSRGPNILAVRVDNSHNEDVPPLNADFTFFGGIYRDVWLVSTNSIHLDVTDHASPGVFVDTPDVSRESATVRVRGRVLNEDSTAGSVTISAAVRFASSTVAEMVETVELPAEQSHTFELQSPSIPSPKLWSPGEPNLYRVVVDVIRNEVVLDRVEVPLGFRWFEVTGQDGLRLNGEHLRLNGTNRHQDYPGYGNAVPNWAHRQDVSIIKDNGFNFLRLAHYPQDPVVLEEADRLGLAIWEEIPVVNIITLSDEFRLNAERMLVEMIRQHYNHPSIIMWGYMNEVMLREPRPEPPGYYDGLLRLTKHLESVTRKEDPGRLTVTAQSVGEVYNGKGLSDVTDILGMNLYFGWYYDTFDTLGTFLDRLHAAHPDRPLLVSEYGAGSDERLHSTRPVRFDFTSEHAQNFHTASFQIMKERPYLVGSAVWNQFDFGSEGRQDSKNAINQKGIYFHDRSAKDIAYYYKSELLSEPVIHIADEWLSRARSRHSDSLEPIWVYTNARDVDLIVNDVPVGSRPVSNSRAGWNIGLRAGGNEIIATAVVNGARIEDRAVIRYHDRTSLFSRGSDVGQTLAVNAGGTYEFIGRGGVVWERDRPYEPGSWGYIGGEPRLVHHRILGTHDDPLYQATREGPDRYQFDVEDGIYDVEILLVDARRDQDRGPFDVTVNEQLLWHDLDLTLTAGLNRAVKRRTEVIVSAGEGIEILFHPESHGTVAGILLRRR